METDRGQQIEPGQDVDWLAHEVIGAAIEVHRHLGPGYLESVYEQALARELGLRAIPYQRQLPVSVMYKGEPIGHGCLDFLVDKKLVVESKAVESLALIHKAQVIS